MAMNAWYEEFEPREGGREIFGIAKARDKGTNDFTHMKQHGVVLRDVDMVIGRGKGYFDKLLNEENPMAVFEEGAPNEGLTQAISRTR